MPKFLCPYLDASHWKVWCNSPNRPQRYKPKYTKFLVNVRIIITKKLTLGGSKLGSCFSPLVDHNSPKLVGLYGSEGSLNAVFQSMVSCSNPEIFAIKSRSCLKLHQNFDVFGLPIFSARQHICCSALFAIARPSVCLSVRLSRCLSHGWISQRRLQLGSRNFHHRVAPWL